MPNGVFLGTRQKINGQLYTEDAEMTTDVNLTELTVVIVASFVSNNSVAAAEVPALVSSIHAALLDIDAVPHRAHCDTPAVPIEESIAHDYLVCLNDGRKLRVLKRYLQRKYLLSPEQYRRKWGLPDDYPMVAPAYSELRSKIARKS
jgi:predicted transcriptional regulator